MSDLSTEELAQWLEQRGPNGCQCGAWYYGECCCSDAVWPEQHMGLAAARLRELQAEVERLTMANARDRMQFTHAYGTERALADRLATLVVDLMNEDPCSFDHHGYCQTHMWFDNVNTCPHAKATAVLAAWEATRKDTPASGSIRTAHNAAGHAGDT